MKNKKKILWITFNIILLIICLVLEFIGGELNNLWVLLVVPIALIIGMIDAFSWAYLWYHYKMFMFKDF